MSVSSSQSETSDSSVEMQTESIKQQIADALKESYSVGDKIGEGSYGKVFSMTRLSDGKELALKSRDIKSKEDESDARNEMNILKDMRNKKMTEHVSYLYGCFRLKDTVFMMFEKLDINLWELMVMKGEKEELFEMEEVLSIGKQILKGLVCIHSLGVIHTDLKPDNIMIVNQHSKPWHVKIIDLGNAYPKSLLSSEAGIACQSLTYSAPENILGSYLSEKIDIWSLGVILAETYTGIPLFPGTSDYQVLKFIIGVCGMPPVSEEAIYWKRYLTKNEITVKDMSVAEYRLKSEDELDVHDVDKGDAEVEMIYPDEGFSRMILYGANHQTGYGTSKDVQFLNWLSTLLNVHPELRVTADEALKSDLFGDTRRSLPDHVGPIRREKTAKSSRTTLKMKQSASH